MSRTHFMTCSLCEAMCGLAFQVEGDEVLGIRGDPDDPLSRGHVCPKGAALPELHRDPDRLRRPVRRTPSGWEEVGWDEALADCGRRLAAIQAEHGRDAVAVYLGNPRSHNYATMFSEQHLHRVLSTRNRFSSSSTDVLPRFLVSWLLYGHQLLTPVPDVDRSLYLLFLGANPIASAGSAMSAPGFARRLQALRGRGGRAVLLDPRRTETAEKVDRHVFIRPGGDAAFLLAVLSVLFGEGLVRPGRLEALTDGLDEVGRVAARFPPVRVERSTGGPAATIREVAREFAAAPSAACYGRVGTSTQPFGTLATWLADAINLVTGNLDREGGAMFPRPAADSLPLARLLGLAGSFDRWRSRVRGLPEFAGELPVATMADEMLGPGPGRVRALVTLTGNPVLSAPNGTRIDEALAGLDLVVAIDYYVNETTRHAHYVFPPVSPLEHDHFDVVFSLFAVRNVARYSKPLFAPPAGAREDWEIVLDLAAAIESNRRLFGRLRGWVRKRLGRVFSPRRSLDFMLRTGPHRGLSLAKVAEAEHGIDLGPLTPCLPGRLSHPGRRIRIAPPELLADLPRLEAWIDRPAPSLELVGRRELRSNNSWMHNCPSLVTGRERCTLRMHPADAASRGLAAGQTVEVRSRVGSIRVPLEVTDEMMPGVVSLPHGWGHSRAGAKLSVAGRRPGASANDVTDDLFLDDLSGTAAFSGTPVEVTAAPRAE